MSKIIRFKRRVNLPPFPSKILYRLLERFQQDGNSWGLAPRQALIIAAVPLAIVLVMAAAVPYFELFAWLTAEDALIEWLQFFLLLASSWIFARLGMRLWRQAERGFSLLYLAAALGLFFIAGEEIAWGQRLFGWGTPEPLARLNYQDETTLHNIAGVHQIFVYGAMFAGLYGVLVPLLAAAFWPNRRRALLGDLLIPPLCLAPALFMPFAYRFSRLVLGIDFFFPRLIFPIVRFSEVTELCLYFGVAVFAWLNLRRAELNNFPKPSG
jgi:hypothetical protein